MRPKFVTLADVYSHTKKELASELLNQNETIWTVEQVATQLGYSSKTIQNLISLDKIPHHKVNGKVLFLKGEIISWIKNDGEAKREDENSAA